MCPRVYRTFKITKCSSGGFLYGCVHHIRRKHCSDDGGRWAEGKSNQLESTVSQFQFLLHVLSSDPIKVPTSSPQNQTKRHIFISLVFIPHPHIIDLSVCSISKSFDFVPHKIKMLFLLLSCSPYYFTLWEIYVFAQDKLTSYTVHNFPKKKCDAYIERDGFKLKQKKIVFWVFYLRYKQTLQI